MAGKLGLMESLRKSKEEFIAEWGALGPAWGMTRSVARIHALLMISENPLTTDEIMEELSISRGGAHGALKQLVAMGMATRAIRKGERKESFVGEKDPWKVFIAVMRERKRREVEPVLAVLDRCLEASGHIEGPEARSFSAQLARLKEFVATGDRVMEKLGRAERSVIINWMLRLIDVKH